MSNLKAYFLFGGLCCWMALPSCAPREHSHETAFTRADSLTDRYLQLQDSVLFAWNTIINDETLKVRSMHALIHELLSSNSPAKDHLVELENRIDYLTSIALTQEALENGSLIEEYDFTNATLVSELISIAESDPALMNHHGVTKCVKNILASDLRAVRNRAFYDEVATRYNKFLERNMALVRELNGTVFSRAKPVFQMASE